MGVLESRANTNPATWGIILLPDELEIDLYGVRLWVACPRGLEESAGVATLRHEHLDSVIDLGILGRS